MEKQKVLLYSGEIYDKVETPLFSGWAKSQRFEAIAKKPNVTWKGSLIPFGLWMEIVGFLRWTQKEFKSEAHMTFFYHEETHKWAAWPFPQEGVGMTVSLLPNHPLYAEDRKQFGKGWAQAGSIHHHCNSSAFASGVDRDDEANKEGIHFTIGKVEEAEIDLHARLVLNGDVYETELPGWIEPADWVKNIPKRFHDRIHAEAVKTIHTEGFPDVWKERVIRRPKYEHVHAGSGYGSHGVQESFPQSMSEWDLAHSAGMDKTAGNEAGRVNGNAGAGMTTHEAESAINGVKQPWEIKVLLILRDIANIVKISLPEMRTYLATPVTSSWSPSQIKVLDEIKKHLKEKSIATLYAEAILDRALRRVGTGI